MKDRHRRVAAAWLAAALLACAAAACVTGGPGGPIRSRGDVGILVAPPQVRDGQVTVGCAAGLIEGELVEDAETGASGGVVATTGQAGSMGGGAIDGDGIRWWACDRGIAPLASR